MSGLHGQCVEMKGGRMMGCEEEVSLTLLDSGGEGELYAGRVIGSLGTDRLFS